jgi:hypothetical protein
VYAIYLDDSGTHHGSHVVVLGGFVASCHQWQNLTREWETMLDDEHLTAFHMTDCENLKGEFSGWSKDRKEATLRRAFSIIRGRVAYGVGVGVLLSAYQSVVVRKGLAELVGGPLRLCMLQVYEQLRQWTTAREVTDPVSYFVENGTDRRPLVEVHAQEMPKRELLIGPLSFVPKSNVAVQAADIIAYESWKHFENRRAFGILRAIRRSALRLTQDIPHGLTCLGKSELRNALSRLRGEGR